MGDASAKTENGGGVVLEFGSKMRRVFRQDGWFNLVSGLGTARDKATFSEFGANGRLTDETLENLYADDPMASRIADTLPEEVFRRGYDIQIASQEDRERREAALGASPDGVNGGELQDPTDEQTLSKINSADAAVMATDLKAHADKLEIQSKFVDGMIWGRVYGLGCAILGADDGARGPNLARPLNTEAIRKFDHINVVNMNPKGVIINMQLPGVNIYIPQFNVFEIYTFPDLKLYLVFVPKCRLGDL